MGIQALQLETCFPRAQTCYWEMVTGALSAQFGQGNSEAHSAGYEPNAPYGPRPGGTEGEQR